MSGIPGERRRGRLRGRVCGRLRAAAAFVLAAGTVLAGAGLLALTPASSASAHNYLVSSTPAPDAVQSEPLDAVTLVFNDIVMSLDTNTSFVEVTGPDGASTHYEIGCPSTSDRTVTAPVALGAAGKYAIVWQIVSSDGHVVSDSQSFSYQPPAGTTPAPGTATPPCPSSESPSSSSADAAAPNTATSSPANLMIVIWIAVAIIVLALIGVVVVLVASRKSKRGEL